MLCEPSVAKLTSTVLSVLSPGLLPFSFRLWWHLNGNHITLSHPLTGSFGSRTNHSLTSVPLPLSIKLSPLASFSFHSFSLSSTADTSGWPGPISSAEPTAACRYGLSVDTVDDLLDAADHRTLVFFLHTGSPNAFFCYFPLIYASQLWWMFWF